MSAAEREAEPRWKLACINWGSPSAPKALTYLLVHGEAKYERFWDTWAEAVEWLNLFPIAALIREEEEGDE